LTISDAIDTLYAHPSYFFGHQHRSLISYYDLDPQ
jgi:hypothetical protein